MYSSLGQDTEKSWWERVLDTAAIILAPRSVPPSGVPTTYPPGAVSEAPGMNWTPVIIMGGVVIGLVLLSRK